MLYGCPATDSGAIRRAGATRPAQSESWTEREVVVKASRIGAPLASRPARLPPAEVLGGSVAGLRYTVLMPDQVRELLLTEAALEKLGARNISSHEAEQVPRNAHVIVRNPRGARPGTRRLLIGRTDGDRALTLVIEQTFDETTWLIVTGWASTVIERRILGE
jgi:hypothetical protein